MPYRETPIIGERSSLDPYGLLLPSELESVIGSGLQIVEPLPVNVFAPESPPSMSWTFEWLHHENGWMYADVGRYRLLRLRGMMEGQPRRRPGPDDHPDRPTAPRLLHVHGGTSDIVHLPEGYVSTTSPRHGSRQTQYTTYRIRRLDSAWWAITRVTNREVGRPWVVAVEMCNVSSIGRRVRNGGEMVFRFVRTNNEVRTHQVSNIIVDPFRCLISLRRNASNCVICNERITTPRLAHTTCPSAGWTIPTPRGGTIYDCPCDACWDIRGGH